MELKDMIALVIGGLILVGIIIYMVINQRSKILEWLKWAVTEAEKALGEKTGQLKLHKVYAWFCEQFPFIAAVLPFQVFSAWVDVALETLDNWIDNNQYAAIYVNKGEVNDNVHK